MSEQTQRQADADFKTIFAAVDEFIPKYSEVAAAADRIVTELRAVRAERDRLREAFAEADKIVDVMLGNGPGAVEAYYKRGKGLPTMYRHLIGYAKDLRALIRAALAAASASGDAA